MRNKILSLSEIKMTVECDRCLRDFSKGGPPILRIHKKKCNGLQVHSLTIESFQKVCVTLYNKAEILQVYSFEYQTASPTQLIKLCNMLPPEKPINVIPVQTELKEMDEDSRRWQNLILRRAPFMNKTSFKNVRVSWITGATGNMKKNGKKREKEDEEEAPWMRKVIRTKPPTSRKSSSATITSAPNQKSKSCEEIFAEMTIPELISPTLTPEPDAKPSTPVVPQPNDEPVRQVTPLPLPSQSKPDTAELKPSESHPPQQTLVIPCTTELKPSETNPPQQTLVIPGIAEQESLETNPQQQSHATPVTAELKPSEFNPPGTAEQESLETNLPQQTLTMTDTNMQLSALSVQIPPCDNNSTPPSNMEIPEEAPKINSFECHSSQENPENNTETLPSLPLTTAAEAEEYMVNYCGLKEITFETEIAFQSPFTRPPISEKGKALELLKYGVPNLITPQPRHFSQDKQVTLPDGSVWPPDNFKKLNGDQRAMAFDYVAMTLMMKYQEEYLDRRQLFEICGSLELPSSNRHSPKTNLQKLKLTNTEFVKAAYKSAKMSCEEQRYINTIYPLCRQRSSPLQESLFDCLEGIPLNINAK